MGKRPHRGRHSSDRRQRSRAGAEAAPAAPAPAPSLDCPWVRFTLYHLVLAGARCIYGAYAEFGATARGWLILEARAEPLSAPREAASSAAAEAGACL